VNSASSHDNAVTLFVMAKNEERCIERCISSAAALVDEVVILDTGSQDNTVELARGLGATVHVTEWPNDFAKARNLGLSFVRTPWVLSLDADEWVINAPDKLSSVVSASPRCDRIFDVGMLMIRHSDTASQADLEGASRLWAPRLFPSHLRYTHPVHEVLVHSLKVERSSILLGHDGYEEEQREHKIGRNLPLLFERLKTTPEDGLLYYYIAQELRAQAVPELNPEIKNCFLESVSKMSDGHHLKEVVCREAISFFAATRDYDTGIKVIFESFSKGVRSAELSYLAASFLVNCARNQTRIDKSLLLSVAEKMFIRVATESDLQSRVFVAEQDTKLMAERSLKATRAMISAL